MADALSRALRVARKEFRVFFASPAAYLFLAAFLAITFFIFFWVETFFARNIADVRPLFQWLPILLIFLVAALTMRSWSEERRTGTLESLLTAPTPPLALVLGKFIAALALVVVALTLTLPLPITVSLLGPLDWGPVVGGYVATLFLAAAYVAIGQAMSARTDNPIVALILSVAVCGLFYLIGAPLLTNLFGRETGDLLALFGTGTRFASIERGVLDLRDIYYYLSIVAIFLALNLYTLERLRWSGNPPTGKHRQLVLVLLLTALNFAAANLWLTPIHALRADITHGHVYTLSSATRHELADLREPLLIRGYFSAKTHPLLAPLVPQIENLLREYAVAAPDRVRVEFIDPQKDRALEEEAAAKYDIHPVPFQTADRYQAAIVNSYFNLVVAYGDQYEVIGYQDLVELKARGASKPDVALKNPEYAVTRAIRKITNAYRSGGNPFDQLDRPITFHGYLSADDYLPAPLKEAHATLHSLLDEMQSQARGKLRVDFADPDADGAKLASRLQKDFGFGPQATSPLDLHPFWFYLMLERDGQFTQVALPAQMNKEALKHAIEAALHRLTPGFLKTVVLFKPAGYGNPGGPRYDYLTQMLGQNVRTVDSDLADGRVPADADMLIVLAPDMLGDKQRFAIDQFLMRGGSVALATSPFDVQINQGLVASKHDSGLKEWLAGYGIGIDDTLVLDLKNATLPVPATRNIGGMLVREMRMLPYPHFADLRDDGLNADNPMTANLDQLTMTWSSPIHVDAAKNKARTVTELLKSSPMSWVSDSTELLPNYEAYPENGFPVSGKREPRLLAVALEGRFDSFYQGKPSPLAVSGGNDGDKAGGKQVDKEKTVRGKDADHAAKPAGNNDFQRVIARSPAAARLIVIGSNAFASDMAVNLISQGLNTMYTKQLDFLQNTIDWSLEDRDLLALRGRTQFARTLAPLEESDQRFWEYANYGLALLGLLLVRFWRQRVAKADRERHARILEEI